MRPVRVEDVDRVVDDLFEEQIEEITGVFAVGRTSSTLRRFGISPYGHLSVLVRL